MARRSNRRPGSAGKAAAARQGEARRETAVSVSRSEWAGPLPPPQVLAQFNEVLPDGAARIVQQWETESGHRREWERRALRAEIRDILLARILAFLFAVLALAGAVYCATLGQTWPAVVIGGGTIAAVVTAMLYGRRE